MKQTTTATDSIGSFNLGIVGLDSLLQYYNMLSTLLKEYDTILYNYLL